MRYKKLWCLFLVVMLLFCNVTFGATKYDVIKAINKTYQVGKEKYRLPQKIIDKGTNYLNKNELTEAQYDNILSCIDKAVALAREVGTTDIKKVSKEDLRRALEILREASSAANVNLDEKLAENNIKIPVGVENVENEDKFSAGNKVEVTPIVDVSKKEEITTEVSSSDTLIDKIDKTDSALNGDYVDSDAVEERPDTIEVSGDSEVKSNDVKNDENVIVVTEKEENKNIDKLIIFSIIVLFIILMVFILILLLILKSKCNRILKYVLVIIFSILIFILFCIIAGVLYYMEELKLIYEIYNMFN